MNPNKRFGGTFLVAVLFVGAQIVVYGSEESPHPLPGNDYVLRSCMSSVELNRRDIDSAKSRLASLPGNSQESMLSTIQSPILRYPAKTNESKDRGMQRSRQILEKRVMRRGRPGREMIADTPLKTLNVERRGRKDGPQIYVKKDLLPEVKTDRSSLTDDKQKDQKNEASIIIIESAQRISSRS